MSNNKGENLIRLKRVRKPVFSDGDVFVLSPVDGIYFYGRVIESQISSGIEWYDSGVIIFIFRCKSKEKTLTNFVPDYNQVWIGPSIVPKTYWTNGWFETIGNIPLTEEEKKLDYGFFNMDALWRVGWFQTSDGKKLDHIPKFFSLYAIKTYTGIFSSLKLRMLLEPKILDFEM